MKTPCSIEYPIFTNKIENVEHVNNGFVMWCL